MAKKDKKPQHVTSEEAQQRMEKYAKARAGELKGKQIALSIISFSLILFIILLVVILKMGGVGKTVVFDANASHATVYTTDTKDVEATRLPDLISDAFTKTTTTTQADNANAQ